MQSDNGVVTVVSNQPTPAARVNDAATQKADFVRLFAGGGNSEGGLIAQLANNPLFTAVSTLIRRV